MHQSAYPGAPDLRPIPGGRLLVSIPAGATTVVVLYAPGGEILRGWPVALSRAGSAFWSALVADTGTLYALAVEPEGDRTASATILAIAPDGSVKWHRTLQEP